MQHHRKSLWSPNRPAHQFHNNSYLWLQNEQTQGAVPSWSNNCEICTTSDFLDSSTQAGNHISHRHKITITALLKELVYCTVVMVLDQLTQHFEFIVFLWFICVVMFQFSIVIFTPTKLTLFLMAQIQNSPETFLSYSASSYKQLLEMCRLPIQHIPKMP